MATSRAHPAVADELWKAAQYYAGFDLDLGYKFTDSYDKAMGLIEEYPHIGRHLFDIFKRVAFKDFPYLLVYRVLDEGKLVRVLAVLHSQQDPKWMKRLLTRRSKDPL